MTHQEARDALRPNLKKQSLMKKDVRERWLATLRSGKYKQGTGYLRQDIDAVACHCCLGVLAEEELGEQWVRREDDRYVYHLGKTGSIGLLTEKAGNSLQLEYDSMHALSMANDSGLSFEEIADAIEECL